MDYPRNRSEEHGDYDDDSEFYGMTEDEIEAVKDERLQEMIAMDIEDEERERFLMTFSEEGQIALEIEALQRMLDSQLPYALSLGKGISIL